MRERKKERSHEGIQGELDRLGCSLVTFITLIDFSMLLETSRCMPQNKEEKEMTKLRDARHAMQKQ